MVKGLETSSYVKAEASAVVCEGRNTGLVGRIDNEEREVTRNQLFCEFEGSDAKESKYVDTLVVDGNVRYTKEMNKPGGLDGLSKQKVTVASKGEPLKVKNARNRTGTLLVTTESAEKQEDRTKGEMTKPELSEENHSTLKKDEVVTKLACKANQGKVINQPRHDCVVTTRDNKIESVADVDRLEISGDVEIIDEAKEQQLRATPRTSIMETDAEVENKENLEITTLKLEDRRDKIREGRK